MDIYSIYRATNIITNKVYIGYTTDLEYRIKRHKKDSLTVDYKFYRSARKHGWDNFIFETIYQSLDENYTKNTMESVFIAEYDSFKNGYNSTTGGDGFSSETNKAMWEDPVFKQKMLKIRQSQWDDDLKEWRSNQTKIQMSDPVLKKPWEAANKKRWDDPEYVKKTCIKRTGSGNNRFDKTIYHFVNDDGREEKCTRYDLYTKHALLSDKVCELVNGNRKSHKGWRIKPNQDIPLVYAS